MHGLVDDAHAAAAQHPEHLVAGDARQRRPRAARPSGPRTDPGSGKSSPIRASSAPEPPPALADLGQQLGRVAADLFGAAARVEHLLEQPLHARVVGHPWASARRLRARTAPRPGGGRPAAPPAAAGRGSAAAAPSWPRRPGPPRPRPGSAPGCGPGRRPRARPPAGPRSPPACGGRPGRGRSRCSGRAGTRPSRSSTAAGCSSKRRARSLSSQRMCWLARAKNWRTVRGRASRMALSSRSTTAPSSSSACRFSGGRVSRG